MNTLNRQISDYSETKRKAYIPAFFFANRELINGEFTNSRDEERLHYGRCLAEVNKVAKQWQWLMAITEELGFAANLLGKIFPGLRKLFRKYSPIKLGPRQDYEGTEEQALAQMLDEIEALMKNLGWNKLFVFLPGMEQTWDAGMARTVINGYCLRRTAKYPGKLGVIGLLGSWPSEGNGYGGAGEQATAFAPAVRDKILPALVKRFGTNNIVCLGHSKGGEVWTQVLAGWHVEKDGDLFYFSAQVAPDRGADEFEACDKAGFVSATQAESSLIFASLRDRLMLLSEVVHMSPEQIFSKLIRWVSRNNDLPYAILRRLEHLRLGQILRLPRWPGIIGVDYTLADGVKALNIFGFYFGWGHSYPYRWIKKVLLLKEEGIRAHMYEKLEHTKLVDRPNHLLCIVAERQEFNSVIEWLDD